MYPSVQSINVCNSHTVERAEMPFNRWMDKEDMVHIYTYNPPIRKDKYPTFVSTWMGLEEIMLSEISQAKVVNYHMVSLTCET